MVALGLRADQGSGLYLTRRPGANLRYPTVAYTYSNPVENPSTNDADQPELGESSLSFMIALELLQAGADVSADASGFYTALHCAASSGWIDHIDALCSFGSNGSNEIDARAQVIEDAGKNRFAGGQRRLEPAQGNDKGDGKANEHDRPRRWKCHCVVGEGNCGSVRGIEEAPTACFPGEVGPARNISSP
jgi:hypothetical protein